MKIVNLIGVRASDLGNLLGELRILEGTMYPDSPVPMAVVGYDVAFDEVSGEQRFTTGHTLVIRVGKRVLTLSVLGILERYGPTPFISPDDSIFVPLIYLTTMKRVVSYRLIIVKAVDIGHVNYVVEQLKNMYGRSVRVLSLQQISEQVSNILTTITIVEVSVASVAFIAAALGTANVMMISVIERTRLIGVLKALGMRDIEVLLLYLLQAVILGLMGGVLGIPMGVVVSHLIPIVMPRIIGPKSPLGSPRPALPLFTPVITPEYVLLALVLAIVSSILASIYPALKAARLNPAEALRYE